MPMSFTAATLRLSAGVLAWALHFAVIYGWTGLACARGLGRTVPWVVGGATLAAAAAAIALLIAGLRDRARFESWMMAGVAAFALVAIVWEGITVLIVPICG